ncbi:hypothetical protein Naga_102371g1 [Nannochloropsis gaditana]|uniref:Uncharacterized protein n=1 Tax=Nannochloropsis gaditana TaxID=72520 RepID=W7TIC9_9STRA|nr:hypothetical protein Naga_102371g1 [Nannochloropsis gaditana]
MRPQPCFLPPPPSLPPRFRAPHPHESEQAVATRYEEEGKAEGEYHDQCGPRDVHQGVIGRERQQDVVGDGVVRPVAFLLGTTNSVGPSRETDQGVQHVGGPHRKVNEGMRALPGGPVELPEDREEVEVTEEGGNEDGEGGEEGREGGGEGGEEGRGR